MLLIHCRFALQPRLAVPYSLGWSLRLFRSKKRKTKEKQIIQYLKTSDTILFIYKDSLYRHFIIIIRIIIMKVFGILLSQQKEYIQ